MLLKTLLCSALAVTALAKPEGHFRFQDISNQLQDTWHDVQQVFHDGARKAEDIAESFVTAVHPAFPEYTIRYKQPALCDPNVKQISGYLDVDDDKHFFFWFFESRNKPKEDPLLLWLNGGPGCSSLTGLFMELGPCTVNKAGDDTVNNPYSWNTNSSVIFLDQPLNVGFSYGNGGASNTVDAAKHVYAFLQLFFKEFSQYASLDFHVSGESYAGHYIPRIGTEVNKGNKGQFSSLHIQEHAHTIQSVNLKSLLIGNGLTDPLIQYKYYAKMACENPYAPALSDSTCRAMEEQYPACARLIENCYKSQNVFSCLPAAMKCNKDQVTPYQQTGLNPYDVREKCKGGNLCYEILESVQTYLNRPEVQKAVGADVEKYESCNMQINFRFNLAGDWMRPYVNEVPPLLEDGIRVLIYAGDADFICNYMGNRAWTLELPWSGKDEYTAAKDKKWKDAAGDQIGILRSTKDGQFAFLQVHRAGHMVPYDQPAAALQMVNQWVHNALE
ncbi:Alpha/Beta hydrolase protein [Gongronella butleri]|nr:Alpha/Beta hydrolase protein [Gongronella butleri]